MPLSLYFCALTHRKDVLMTLLAIGLVLLSAVLHATWNLLAKRVQGDASFT